MFYSASFNSATRSDSCGRDTPGPVCCRRIPLTPCPRGARAPAEPQEWSLAEMPPLPAGGQDSSAGEVRAQGGACPAGGSHTLQDGRGGRGGRSSALETSSPKVVEPEHPLPVLSGVAQRLLFSKTCPWGLSGLCPRPWQARWSLPCPAPLPMGTALTVSEGSRTPRL